jgi:sodium-dependent phosphate cotransporter
LKKKEIIKRIILLAVILYVFLLSIKLMGGSFKLFGSGFAEQLVSITSNPLVGLFIGILATAIVQSSSVTTSIVVGLAASGNLGVGSAIPIIMGANIGTSITSLIVSLGHIGKREEFKKAISVATTHDFFNFIAVIILFPLEISFHFLERSATFLTQFFLSSSSVQFANPLNLVLNPSAGIIKSLLANSPLPLLLTSFVLLFLSLRYFVKIIRPLAESEFRNTLNNKILKSPLRGFSLGLLLTALIQSSSASISLIVPLAGAGLLVVDKIFPYIIGANIGTTVTAILASLATGSPVGMTVAFGHMLFNVFGSIMVYPLRRLPISMSKFMANLSFKCRAYPIAYIVTAFYILPLFIIFTFS